jgi:hypothetical protein
MLSDVIISDHFRTSNAPDAALKEIRMMTAKPTRKGFRILEAR